MAHQSWGRLLTLALAGSFCFGTLPAGSASAETVPIVSYDVGQTPMSGWGYWFHSYAGTVVDTGRTVSSAVYYGNGNHLANYSGGSGTLNDGSVSLSTTDNHLFTTRNADDGLPIEPVITLHLGESVYVKKIAIYGGDIGWNAIPGALSGVTVEISGSSVHLQTVPFGPANGLGVPVDDLLDLTGTPLSGILTSTIVLKGFVATLFGSPFDQFSVTEITVEGERAGIEVAIDVKPDDLINAVNTNEGVVPVAILGTATFSVSEVDVGTLTFGATGSEQSLAFCNPPEDVNGDGLPDPLCKFKVALCGFAPTVEEVFLKGKTLAGSPLSGSDLVLTRR